MRIISLADIKAALDEEDAIAAVAEGFRRYSAGEVQLSAVGHLGFADAGGDCHVKGAYIEGDDVFVVKLATGFYRNPERGMASCNGFMAVVSAKTGEPLALLADEGYLTDLRTAMAGAIAARRILRPGSSTLGVVGTGGQAELQARFIAKACGLETIRIWGRDPDASRRVAAGLRDAGFNAHAESALGALCAASGLIVTTTPSTEPLIMAGMVEAGARIVAVGADSPGKCELDPGLVAKAGLIVVDSRQQCIDHGEIQRAAAAGLIDPGALVELGTLLADSGRPIDAEAIVIVDLTGLGVQDAQIAKSVWRQLSATRAGILQ
jgi:ornithine cyclodeaminase